MKFYTADWIQDTRHLSLSAKGAWIELICLMWINRESRGEYQATKEALQRAIGATSGEELNMVITELQSVANVTLENGIVTVMSRRIVREETGREFARKRKQRERGDCNVTPESRNNHALDVQTFRRSDVQTKALKPSRAPKSAAPFWKPMIEHLDVTWSLKKRGTKYPWSGKDMAHLKRISRLYNEWGVMALWDVYLATDDDWARKNGFNVVEFVRQIPRLVDGIAWKNRAADHEKRLIESQVKTEPVITPPEVASLIAGLGKEITK